MARPRSNVQPAVDNASGVNEEDTVARAVFIKHRESPDFDIETSFENAQRKPREPG